MKTMHAAVALLSIGGNALTASPVAGQQAADTAIQPARANPAPVDRFGLFDGQQLEVSTGTDDDKLTFRAALPTGPAIMSRFSLSVSTPLHGGDQAMPASLDALANGSRVTLSWGYFGLPLPDPDPIAEGIANEAMRLCAADKPDERRCQQPHYAVVHYKPENYFQFRSHSIPGAWDFGLDATVGINDFEWVDPATLMSRKDRRTDWSAAGHFTYYFAGSMTAFTGSASYQRAYQAVDEQLLCPPAPANPATACITARGAAPNRNENFLLSAGLRHRFVVGGRLLPLAVAPLVTYDVIDDVFGVDVPIYFIPGANGGLTGGVRFGYRSDRDDRFSVGVFVGAAFNIRS